MGERSLNVVVDNTGPIDVNLDTSLSPVKISNPISLFDSNFIYDKQELYWDETTGTGGTSTYLSNQPLILMSTTTTSGSYVYRQTRQKFKYQPGKRMVVLISGNIGVGQSNLRQRCGYFNTQNGLFFECNNGLFYVVSRSYVTGSPIDTSIVQSSWNYDTMDGNGISGINIDFSKLQQFIIDFDWMGTGYIKFGFIINGEIKYCHILNYSNLSENVYMTSPILPIRYEIQNIGTTASTSELTQATASIWSEGGYNPKGVIRSIDNGVSNVTIPSGSYAPFFEIQLRSDRIGGMIQPLKLTVTNDGNSDINWQLLLNPTVTGGVGSYANISTNSIGQSRLASTATITYNSGTVIASGYVSSTLNYSEIEINTDIYINSNIAGTSDTLVLCVRKVGGGAADTGRASITFKEFI